MAFKITSDGQLLTVSFAGVVTDTEMLQMREALYAHPNHANSDQLVDLSAVTEIAITPKGAVDYSESSRQRPEPARASADRRMAVCAPSDVAYGMSRLMAARANFAGFNMQVFRSLDEALNFLQSDANEEKIAENRATDPEKSHSKLTR